MSTQLWWINIGTVSNPGLNPGTSSRMWAEHIMRNNCSIGIISTFLYVFYSLQENFILKLLDRALAFKCNFKLRQIKLFPSQNHMCRSVTTSYATFKSYFNVQ